MENDRWTEERTNTASPCMCQAILKISGTPKDTFVDMTVSDDPFIYF